MTTILDRIVVSKKEELEAAKNRASEADLERRLGALPPCRDFLGSLRCPNGVRVIAEVKKASPSAGVFRSNFDPVAIAKEYQAHGAACISVLTDAPFFQGDLKDLTAVHAVVDLPVLRKDFIIERYQLLEARLAGADAVLLIAEILKPEAIAALVRQAESLGLQALVELYDPANLQPVLDSGARMIGVNNRNLRTFETRLEHTLDIAVRIPGDRCLVSESGIRTHADVQRLLGGGVQAILVGESLMRSPNAGRQLELLRGADISQARQGVGG
jgi:indole-3-glycerol phosphate synthase